MKSHVLFINEKKLKSSKLLFWIIFFWLPNCANLFSVILISIILDLCIVMKFQIFFIYSWWWNSYVSNKRFNHTDFSYFLELIYSIKHRQTLNFHNNFVNMLLETFQNFPLYVIIMFNLYSMEDTNASLSFLASQWCSSGSVTLFQLFSTI